MTAKTWKIPGDNTTTLGFLVVSRVNVAVLYSDPVAYWLKEFEYLDIDLGGLNNV